MDAYDWLLFFHVLAAFMTIASVVIFGVLLGVARQATSASEAPALRLWSLGFNLWNVGGLGTIVLGIILAIHVDAYEPWDGWIIAAYVLWAIASFAGTRTALGYRDALDGEGGATLATTVRSTRGVVLYAVMTLAVTLLLIDMVYKPGA